VTVRIRFTVVLLIGAILLSGCGAPNAASSQTGIPAKAQLVDCGKAWWLAAVLHMKGPSGHLSPAAVATLRTPDVDALVRARNTPLFASMSRALIHGVNPFTGPSAAYKAACASLINDVERS
jgi:hypothetical protein